MTQGWPEQDGDQTEPGRGRIYGSRRPPGDEEPGSQSGHQQHPQPGYQRRPEAGYQRRPEAGYPPRPEAGYQPTQHLRFPPPGPRLEHPPVEPQPGRRFNARVLTAVAVSVALVIGLITIGWAMIKPDDEPGGLSANAADSSTTPPALTDTPTPTPTATPTPTPKPTPKPTKTRPKPVVTTKPPVKDLPPPPPPPKPDTSSCLTYLPGGNADKATVASVLAEAGSVDYWDGVQATPNPPPLSVSAQMMKAFAYVESTWRSTVIACDGGIGLMQVMPGTATWLNQRFDFSPAYDPKVIKGNAALGAALIQYLTFYFGSIYYGGEYDLDTVAPVGDEGASVRLRDVVIAAYNVGWAAVENDNGTTDWADDTLSIPNQWYVDRVVNAMNTSPWTAMAEP